MRVAFELDEHEDKVTPIGAAYALINSDIFDEKDLKELIAYLSVYTRYNKEK